jgi:small subunit ribosomal protein S17
MPEQTEAQETEAETAETEAAPAETPEAAEVTDTPVVPVATRAPTVVAAAEATADQRHNRKTREGLVVSDKMDKTAVVAVIERVRHAKYGKFMMRTKRLYAHDETNDAHIGDRVTVMETRPLSKNKRWRLVEVLERAK